MENIAHPHQWGMCIARYALQTIPELLPKRLPWAE